MLANLALCSKRHQQALCPTFCPKQPTPVSDTGVRRNRHATRASHHGAAAAAAAQLANRASGLVGVLDLALGDLLEGHRQVVLRAGLDERRQLLECALAELMVVVVDLARTLGRDDHECVAAVDVPEEFVETRLNHAAMLPV